MQKRKGIPILVALYIIVFAIAATFAAVRLVNSFTKPETTWKSDSRLEEKSQSDSQLADLEPVLESNSEPKVYKDEESTKALKKYLKENFGMPGYETSWYRLISDIEVNSDQECTVRTDIYPDDEGKRIAGTIAGAVMGCQDVELKRVMVTGQDNHPLAVKSAY